MSEPRPAPTSEKQTGLSATASDAVSPKTADNVVTSDQQAMSDSSNDLAPAKEEWVTGIKLWLLMTPLCFTFFLVLLDVSIIATVSTLIILVSLRLESDFLFRPSLKSPTNSNPFLTWDGMALHISWPALHCSH